MPPFVRAFAIAAALVATTFVPAARAQDAALTAGVRYEPIGRWDVARLNEILNTGAPAFSGVSVTYTPARYAVDLYRITYDSVVPERANRPIVATGLLAVPVGSGETRLPLVSYQHGTVYGKDEVPSVPDESFETQLMIAQFAAQGYLLVGADYFGMGASKEPEGYMVKASHQQAGADMLRASRVVLDHLGVDAGDLFLAGWSQGGFVTMALLETLERDRVPVAATATASAPVDIFVALNGFLNFPRPNDASWTGTLFILSSFAFENYYGVPGLARSLIAEEFYEVARKAYNREPVDPAAIPTDLRKLIRRDYFDASFFAASAYGRLVASTQAYRWVVRTPVRNYFGENDEAISIGLGQLAATYQRAIGNPNVEAVSTGATTHRGTFARAVPQWKVWFDGLAQIQGPHAGGSSGTAQTIGKER